MPIFEIPPEVESDVSQPLLSKESGEAVRQKVDLDGMDALGWYVTFHQRSHPWGIYVPVSGLSFMMIRSSGSFSLNNKPIVKYLFDRRCNLFHFLIV